MNATTTKFYLSMTLELLKFATSQDLEALRHACEDEIRKRDGRVYAPCRTPENG